MIQSFVSNFDSTFSIIQQQNHPVINKSQFNTSPGHFSFKTIFSTKNNQVPQKEQIKNRKNQNSKNKENISPNTFIFPKTEKKKEKSQITEKYFPYEYEDEIYQTLMEDSKKQDYSYENISSVQVEINHKMRSILVDWLITLHYHFRLSESTLFLTVNLIDRYISFKSIPKKKFQLLGVTSFLIATKYEEIYSPESLVLSQMTENAASAEEILSFESEILSLLKFNLSFPHSYDIYQFMSNRYNFVKKEFYLGLFILEGFLLDVNSTKYYPDMISEAACYLVMKFTKKVGSDIQTNLIKNNSHFRECIMDMYIYIKDLPNTNYKAIMHKFSNERFLKISEMFGKI